MADTIFASTRKGLVEFRRTARGWTQHAVHFLGSPVSVTLAGRDGATLIVALNLGHFGVKLHRSTDAGATWKELAPPAFPKADGKAADDAAPANKGIWSLAFADPANPNALWCGTAPAGLFHSPDLGDTWSMNQGLWTMPERSKWFGGGTVDTILHSICVDPRNARRVAVAISCGGVNLTEDGGKTWRVASRGMFATYMPPVMKDEPSVQDPHMVVQSPSNPAVWWCQHHNGIFRSTDDLAGWHEIINVPVSNFGFAVAVHPKNADVAWFVPAISDEIRAPVGGALAATRTTDGGKSFDVIRRGLPQGGAFDLIYRHGLAVDSTGRQLAMGSTTGGLWSSDDGGDGWTLISAHLPPIHAITMA
ncbi:MAG: hypothetical protein SFV21_01150 [Rhodospirillaceae bacterium]|nr:hypothetical protein [Rhodospirillaceae bacterium]